MVSVSEKSGRGLRCEAVLALLVGALMPLSARSAQVPAGFKPQLLRSNDPAKEYSDAVEDLDYRITVLLRTAPRTTEEQVLARQLANARLMEVLVSGRKGGRTSKTRADQEREDRAVREARAENLDRRRKAIRALELYREKTFGKADLPAPAGVDQGCLHAARPAPSSPWHCTDTESPVGAQSKVQERAVPERSFKGEGALTASPVDSPESSGAPQATKEAR